jgi:hypothetical protein
VRIVTWNCGMALARKAPNLLALNLDIAVVQGCSKKSVDVLHGHGLSGLWFGANPNKRTGGLLQQRVYGSRRGRAPRQVRCAHPPLQRNSGAALLPAGNPENTVLFRYGETTDFECHRVENQFPAGRVQRLSRRTVTPTVETLALT